MLFGPFPVDATERVPPECPCRIQPIKSSSTAPQLNRFLYPFEHERFINHILFPALHLIGADKGETLRRKTREQTPDSLIFCHNLFLGCTELLFLG